MSDDPPLSPFFVDYDDKGREPPPAPEVKKLIAEVTKKLKVRRKKRAECATSIRLQFRAARGSSRSTTRRLCRRWTSRRKRRRPAWRCVRRKTRSRRSSGFYAPLWIDFDHDGSYYQFARLLDTAIAVGDAFGGTVIREGSRRRDVNKYSAEAAARYLVSEFPARIGAGQREALRGVREPHRPIVLQGADGRD